MGLYRVTSKVNIKSREVTRKLKDGTIKQYTFHESQLKLPREHDFKHDQEVIIIDYQEYTEMIEGYATEIENLNKLHENEKEDLERTHNILESKYLSQQKRLNQLMDQVNELENKNRELESRGLWDMFRKKIKRPALNK